MRRKNHVVQHPSEGHRDTCSGQELILPFSICFPFLSQILNLSRTSSNKNKPGLSFSQPLSIHKLDLETVRVHRNGDGDWTFLFVLAKEKKNKRGRERGKERERVCRKRSAL